MAGWLHGVFVGEWLFVFPLCGFSLSLFCNSFMRPAVKLKVYSRTLYRCSLVSALSRSCIRFVEFC